MRPLGCATSLSRPGISRRTFYEHYRDKDEAFRAVHQEALISLESAVGCASSSEPDWGAAVTTGLEAALAWAAITPPSALLVAAEPFASGSRLGHCRDQLFASFAPTLRCGRHYNFEE